MSQGTMKIGKKILRGSPCESQIERVGTEIDLTGPFQGSAFSDHYLLKDSWNPPGSKDSTPSISGKIDAPGASIIKSQENVKIFLRLGFDNFHSIGRIAHSVESV